MRARGVGSQADDSDGQPDDAQIIDSSHGSFGVVAIADGEPDVDEPVSAAKSIA